jgi:hypothetical protein
LKREEKRKERDDKRYVNAKRKNRTRENVRKRRREIK